MAQLHSSWTWSHNKLHYQRWTFYSQLRLLQAIVETGDTKKPNITSVEEINAGITIFTARIKSAENASKLYYTRTYPPQDPALPDLTELLRRIKKSKGNHEQF
jgi:hypothetical protein